MSVASAGMSHHHKIYFRGEADEKPNEIPGDVIFIVEQQVSSSKYDVDVDEFWFPSNGQEDANCSSLWVAQEHEVFKRRGSDLFMTKKITLYEALCGFQFLLTHLDDRQLLIQVWVTCLKTCVLSAGLKLHILVNNGV